jgi:hypothetical protein
MEFSESKSKLIYEQADGIIYARKIGDPHTERIEVNRTEQRKIRDLGLKEAKLWGDIRRAAESNLALQDALNRVILIYHLSRKDDA